MKRFLLYLSFCFPITAQELHEAPSQRRLSSPVEIGQNVALPAHVLAARGELTLFADFDHAWAGDEYQAPHIPLYLVNRSVREPSIDTGFVENYIKLECLLPDGSWARADADPGPGCGLRMWDHYLAPGEHFKFQGYRPKGGIKSKVRYVSCHPRLKLVSNIGDGEYFMDDVEASKRDRISIRGVPATLYEKIRRDDLSNETVAAFALLREFGPVPALDELRDARIDQLQKADLLSKDQTAILASLLELKTKPKHVESRQYKALGLRCLEALEGHSVPAKSFGSPESVPEITWSVLTDLTEMETNPRYAQILPEEKLPASFWKKVYKLAIARIIVVPQQQQYIITKLLGQSAYADEFLVNASWEPLLRNDTWAVRSVAAETLVRREERGRVIEIATKLKPEYRIAILGALADLPPRYRIEDGDHESAFWETCVRQHPLKAVYVLNYEHNINIDGFNPYGDFVHRPLREFWLAEAEREQSKSEDYDLGEGWQEASRALEFFIAWRDKEDIPVFETLLKHRGFTVREERPSFKTGTKPVFIRQYPFRGLAKQAMMRLGQNVPADIITEQEIPAPTVKSKK